MSNADLDKFLGECPTHKKLPWKIGAMESGQVAIDSDDGKEVTGWIDLEDACLILNQQQRIEELRTQINALRCAIKAVQENGNEQSFVSLYETLAATPEQPLTEYRNKVIEQMIACYSPDDSAHDYFDKLNALKDQK